MIKYEGSLEQMENLCDIECSRGLDCHECGHSLKCIFCCTNDQVPFIDGERRQIVEAATWPNVP